MFEPIVKMEDRWEVEGSSLTFYSLMELSKSERYKIYSAQCKANGRSRAPDRTVLERYDRVLRAYDSIDYEGISLRGIYYRVVSLFGEAKTEQTYSNYQKVVSDMRDYGILPFELVLDGTRTTYNREGYRSKESFIRAVSSSYKIHRWSNQPVKPVLAVEKLAMVDILLPVCDKWGISLIATRGFNSKTGWYNLMQLKDPEQKLDILILSDYDTAGIGITRPGQEAIIQHDMIGKVGIRRIGLTPEQIEDMGLITREDKVDKSMAACELDAMTPQQAKALVESVLETYLPRVEIDQIIEQEQREREGLELLEW